MHLDVRNRQPPSEKVHQIIARTALFVSEHGGQSEIVLRIKQGSNPTFGFLMPDHHLHSYFRYLVDHPQLLKDSADAVDRNKGNRTVNNESEHASTSGALSLLGTAYDSGDEDEGTLSASSKGIDPGSNTSPDVQGHGKSSSSVCDDKVGKDGTVTAGATAVKGKPTLAKKNPMLTGNNIVSAHREKVKHTITASTTDKSENSNSCLSEIKEMILEPPSFLKRTMEKIVEFIITNGKEFEEKLIEQDRTTGRFPFLLSSNPYYTYYLKILQETQESKFRGRSSERKDRSSSMCKDRRSSLERKDRRSLLEHQDSSRSKEGTISKAWPTAGMDSTVSERSLAKPSEKQLYDQQGKGKFQMVVGGVKKEPPRKVTADEAAAIVMAATRGLGPANDSRNTLKKMRDDVHTRGSNDHSSSFGSFSSLQDQDAKPEHTSNSEADTSLTSSGQLKKEGTGIIDDDWITNTIAKAAAVAASKEADSSEASMTKEQKLKAERLRRAKMFAAIIKSGGNKMNDLAIGTDPTNEPTKASPADMNVSSPYLQPAAKEREDSSAPFEQEGSIATKQEKDSDNELNRVRKYRKHHPESDEKDDSEESYKHLRKRHRSEHSRSHSKDVHKHKHKSHSSDLESRHYRRRHGSSEDEHEHRSSKSRHRHRDDEQYSDDDKHRRSRRHRRDHRSTERKHEYDRDQSEQTLGRSAASPSTSNIKFVSERPPGDTAQSSEATTEVPSELRAKIRAMLLETL
ncbi:uncharacterized protein LOC133918665 isoform X2 [Phragmites australis]|uniref:uncharacterized protein LOC133918665 isoform X2 n=1 Tax=Phragmites australis TaxID=29695 RepID=UPI002D79F2CC|nr:uncharacterized protein LOC133918665 isoform X2 [Phragmites australis]XP_062218652.1 uncharacterized protein LOC133918665 isoform X2 [Phragmites australis]XP_062218660.1 uncharacterized protein LOC133918665 isoform X2 [Phragmites australis]XP_062218670.1 uncharacterized protein LOC133918665 isoform X2 [Phragmites australis]